MKKLLFLYVLILIIASVAFADAIAPVARPIGFKDLEPSHWAYYSIIEMKQKEYINGYEDGSFRPDNTVTREEFAQMVYNVERKVPSFNKLRYYADVDNTRWSYNAVQLVGYSIMDENGAFAYFYPTRPIQRQEVAKVLSDYYEMNADTPENVDAVAYLLSKLNLIDKGRIDSRYVDAVYNMYNSGLMNGMSATEFAPDSSLTRAQAATLLLRITKMPKPTFTPVPTPIPTTVITPAPVASVDLDLAFLKLEENKKNLIYSPLSIKYALKMLDEGANGNTKVELDNLVGGINPTRYFNINNIISVANSVFIRDSYKNRVLESYTNELQSKYDAELKYDPFTSAGNMNNWISNKTFGLIKNMIQDASVTNPNCKMVLINALAIQMEWQNKFSDVDVSSNMNFIGADGKQNSVKALYKNMVSDGSEAFYLDDSVQSVSLDLKEYNGTTLQFVAIMPKDETLSSYVSKVTSSDVDKIINHSIDEVPSEYNKVRICLPQFKYESNIGLVKDLSFLGVNDAFVFGKADFSKITGDKELFVSDVHHIANIEFTRDGIKASAATAIMMTSGSVAFPTKPDLNIIFDHPSLLFLFHNY